MTSRVDHFVHRCTSDILHGLQEGLSEFSGPSRVAVIYCLTPQSKLYICDPQSLLKGYDPALRMIFSPDGKWCVDINLENDKARYGHILPEKNLGLDGLVSYGGRSGSVFYQMWFTEHHPDICSIGPTERWLEYAVLRFSHDIANEQELYSGISGSFLKEYATHAVRDCIIDECNFRLGIDSKIRIYPVLKAILGISKTLEEGALPDGSLLFVEPRLMGQLSFLARFNEGERPQLDNCKHVRKLLQSVKGSGNRLVSDGVSIVGIASDEDLEFSILVEFNESYGFIKTGEETVCSFFDGKFHSTTNMAKLVEVEESLLEAESLSSDSVYKLFHIISALVHNAEKSSHGCTLVIDLESSPLDIPGQKFEQPLDLSEERLLSLAASLSAVDGALHIDAESCLRGFSCLLDGRSIYGEDLARGARYNSALRFSKEHDGVIVVVVSSDRPVSVIRHGIEMNGQCTWRAPGSCVFKPRLIEEWLDDAK
ncbi:nucleotide-binding DisA bacterial checkpoint controller [Desulfocapsa sulfexigens DSM 10523]|uniref:Nucleotide-binding DisA bacterial checkpoint controller n=1 Tax=Desulfocapsa sulfexigens (strain DSM 10523 / SB164P1) TaxID=1167006 RepID=M1P7F6_DESSD|nr:DNA integrity scanning protein DisA nucleotide-binding domain protein [Desulfocapsa sulfexigens]AGF77627.1 nucleotide-binding DisA bacterial checkpoint controller [Desulfocapsa sulfexigens DSM 10523]